MLGVWMAPVMAQEMMTLDKGGASARAVMVGAECARAPLPGQGGADGGRGIGYSGGGLSP